MKILNIGILAHVDAGKTSLTERLLFNAGVLHTLGSVDHGTTHTDSLALERRRGITIKAAVASCTVGDLKLNLVDTPGHPDFIAEVERSLRVLDAVILVISAVEGVQPNTRVIMRALQRLRIPTLIFINKVDRRGARDAEVVAAIQDKLFRHVIAINTVTHIGTPHVKVTHRKNPTYLEELRHTLADTSEAFLSDLVNKPEKLDIARCKKELGTHVSAMQICPVFFGSAIKGVGVPELTQALETYVEPPQTDARGFLSAIIFKIERGPRGEKIVYLRMYSGELRTHTFVDVHMSKTHVVRPAKITALHIFQDGKTKDVSVARAGDIAKVWGLSEGSINDYLGQAPQINREPALVRPSFEVIVTPRTMSDAPRLSRALQDISDQDPFVEARQNPGDGTLSVRLCGEVQKEVIEATLAADYHIEAELSETTPLCIERPAGAGEGTVTGEKGDPYLGTVGLHIEPGPIGSGLDYRLATTVRGTLPPAFFTAIEETVPRALERGMHGWHVTDCKVTLTKTGYWPRQSHAHASFDKSMSSTAGDFRSMTRHALKKALTQAATVVYEPINRFELDIPLATLTRVMQSLAAAEARLERTPLIDKDTVYLEGFIPARRTFACERQIPDLTGGEGVFVAEHSGYQEVRGHSTGDTATR